MSEKCACLSSINDWTARLRKTAPPNTVWTPLLAHTVPQLNRDYSELLRKINALNSDVESIKNRLLRTKFGEMCARYLLFASDYHVVLYTVSSPSNRLSNDTSFRDSFLFVQDKKTRNWTLNSWTIKLAVQPVEFYCLRFECETKRTNQSEALVSSNCAETLLRT